VALRDPRTILLLPEPWRTLCIVLNIVPVPGVGAIIAGIKNPHSGLLKVGIAQALLVLFGSYPLIFPGAIGFVWACWTSYRMFRDAYASVPWSTPV